ncbi:MAG: GNAT family protein [Chloroflexota bacterium]
MTAAAAIRDRLAAAWPLFGLEIRSERLSLRLPTDGELLQLMDLVRAGIHPPDEMPFASPWSVLPSPAFERGYLTYHWTNRTAFSADAWELGLAVSLHGTLVGMQGISARAFPAARTVHTGSWLGMAHQGQGFGKEMRAAVLAFAFDGLAARVAETEAYLDNAASSAVSRAVGYEENGFGTLAPYDTPRETRRFRMTVEQWRSRPRPAVEIIGLDACRDQFGI